MIGTTLAHPRVCSGTITINFSRRKHEETEGFLSYRIADRRGDHSDHRGYRYSEFAQGERKSVLLGRSVDLCGGRIIQRKILDFVFADPLRRYFRLLLGFRSGIRSASPWHYRSSL